MYNNIMNTLIITNNEKVNIEFINDGNVEYHEDAEQTEILLIARNYYSRSYLAQTVSHGSFPFLRTGTKPLPNS